MLSNDTIEQRFKDKKDVFYVKVEGDGYKYHITIVTDIFLKKSKVARQQWVYAELKELITTGTLHAISMQTWTKEEWGNHNG